MENNGKSAFSQLQGALRSGQPRADNMNRGFQWQISGSYVTPRVVSDMDFKGKFSAGSEVLQRLFEDGKSPLSGPFLRWKLWARWSEVVGPTMAEAAEPVGFQRGTLWIWVRNSSWMQQMIFMREQIRTTINQKMGSEYVRVLRFTLDRREVPADVAAQQDLKALLSQMAPEDRDLE